MEKRSRLVIVLVPQNFVTPLTGVSVGARFKIDDLKASLGRPGEAKDYMRTALEEAELFVSSSSKK